MNQKIQADLRTISIFTQIWTINLKGIKRSWENILWQRLSQLLLGMRAKKYLKNFQMKLYVIAMDL